MQEYGIKISRAILWTAMYFGIMLFYTAFDIAVWRKAFGCFSNWLNVITIAFCAGGFIVYLKKAAHPIAIFSNVSFAGVLSAVLCSVLFFLLLDNFLDPIFARAFPQSEQNYQEAVRSLAESPVTALLQVCIIAPVIEEILMRGYILGGLKNNYGIITALLLSSALFALLHFNMVQTLSAFLCGVILGFLYVKTNSVFCCILAHCGYNFISYIAVIYPKIRK